MEADTGEGESREIGNELQLGSEAEWQGRNREQRKDLSIKTKLDRN